MTVSRLTSCEEEDTTMELDIKFTEVKGECTCSETKFTLEIKLGNSNIGELETEIELIPILEMKSEIKLLVPGM